MGIKYLATKKTIAWLRSHSIEELIDLYEAVFIQETVKLNKTYKRVLEIFIKRNGLWHQRGKEIKE